MHCSLYTAIFKIFAFIHSWKLFISRLEFHFKSQMTEGIIRIFVVNRCFFLWWWNFSGFCVLPAMYIRIRSGRKWCMHYEKQKRIVVVCKFPIRVRSQFHQFVCESIFLCMLPFMTEIFTSWIVIKIRCRSRLELQRIWCIVEYPIEFIRLFVPSRYQPEGWNVSDP